MTVSDAASLVVGRSEPMTAAELALVDSASVITDVSSEQTLELTVPPFTTATAHNVQDVSITHTAHYGYSTQQDCMQYNLPLNRAYLSGFSIKYS